VIPKKIGTGDTMMTITSEAWAKAKGFCPTKNPPETEGLILNL
jgi:hypothetical protein